jgi:hypothetical protein
MDGYHSITKGQGITAYYVFLAEDHFSDGDVDEKGDDTGYITSNTVNLCIVHAYS